MSHRSLDMAAGATAVGAPLWTLPIDTVNQWLTFASLLIGLAFLCWRWWRSWLRERRLTRCDQ